MKKPKRYLALLSCAVILLSLAACGKKAPAADSTPAAEKSPVTASQAPESSPETIIIEDAETEKEMTGTVNIIDSELDLLVLVTDEGYYKFNINGVDLKDFAAGDYVSIKFTGTAQTDSDETSANLVSIQKAEQPAAAK